MCGRLACTLAPGTIKRSFVCCGNNEQTKDSKNEFINVPNYYEYAPFYNGPPTTVVPVLAWKSNFPDIKETDSVSPICLISMRWGMIPIYQAENSGTYHTHNARFESILKSPLYKPCLTSGKRCVVLVNGYYEWKTTDGENHKEPYFVYQTPNAKNHDALLNIHDNKYVMKLAGVFNIIREGNIVKYTCTIITRESDDSMAWLHHRIPIILDSIDDIENWLNPDTFSYEEALQRLPVYSNKKPRNEEYKLRYHIVDKSFVNKSTCNDAKCMERKTLKRKSINTLDSWLKKAKKSSA